MTRPDHDAPPTAPRATLSAAKRSMIERTALANLPAAYLLYLARPAAAAAGVPVLEAERVISAMLRDGRIAGGACGPYDVGAIEVAA